MLRAAPILHYACAKGGGGGITVFLLRNTVYPPPPSISVFLSLWEGGRSDGTLRYMYNGGAVYSVRPIRNEASVQCTCTCTSAKSGHSTIPGLRSGRLTNLPTTKATMAFELYGSLVRPNHVKKPRVSFGRVCPCPLQPFNLVSFPYHLAVGAAPKSPPKRFSAPEDRAL